MAIVQHHLNLQYNLKIYYKFLMYLLLALLTTWCADILALPNDSSSPIDIVADAVEFNEANNTSTYKGSVEAQQGSMHLWADQVKVIHYKSRQPKRIIATGNPTRYQQQERNGSEISNIEASAKRMEYNLATDEILLIHNAKLTRDKDIFSSDRIYYNRTKGIIRGGSSAKGNQRVRIRIVPKAKPSNNKTKSRNRVRVRMQSRRHYNHR